MLLMISNVPCVVSCVGVVDVMWFCCCWCCRRCRRRRRRVVVVVVVVIVVIISVIAVVVVVIVVVVCDDIHFYNNDIAVLVLKFSFKTGRRLKVRTRPSIFDIQKLSHYSESDQSGV